MKSYKTIAIPTITHESETCTTTNNTDTKKIPKRVKGCVWIDRLRKMMIKDKVKRKNKKTTNRNQINGLHVPKETRQDMSS